MPLSDSLSTDIPSSDGLQPPQSHPQQNTVQPSPMAVIRPRNQNQRQHTETITIEPENIQPAPQQIQARAVSVSTTSCTSEESEESLPDSFEEGRAPLLRRAHSSVLVDDAYGGIQQHQSGENPQLQEYQTKARRKIPKERQKTAFALLLLVFAGALNDLVLSYIHELIPETKPLPDFAFTHTPYWASALIVSEYLMIMSCVCMFTIAIAHKYRWVVIRRIFVIASLLYLGRCITMFVTQVPVADENYYCSPKLKPEERTFWAILSRALSVLIGLGLKINGRHTLCGDYIYSGHTIVHVICYMFIREYSPQPWFPLHWLSFLFSTIGVFSLLISRGHYSIDIIIAYWITTRVFWLYHTLADLPALRNDLQERNKIIRTIWFPLFTYMEGNVQRPVPRKYGIPFPLPERIAQWLERRRRSGSTSGERGPDMDRLIGAD